MTKQAVSIAFIVLLGCIALTSFAGSGATASAQTGPPTGQSGRFVAVAPPSGPDGYTNFLWVLDTEIGLVDAYRIVSVKEHGEHVTWATERVPNEFDLALSNDKAQQAAPPSEK